MLTLYLCLNLAYLFLRGLPHFLSFIVLFVIWRFSLAT